MFPLSIFDPVHLGINKNGEQVHVDLAERNMLLGGEPGGGKSNALTSSSPTAPCRTTAAWSSSTASRSNSASGGTAPTVRRPVHGRRPRRVRLQAHERPLRQAPGRRPRKITRQTGNASTSSSSTIRLFSATVGDKTSKPSSPPSRDLVARGRAAGVIVILATQRPSHQVIDPSMRDLFGYRWAFRCTTDPSSDVVLGQGWAAQATPPPPSTPSPAASPGCCPKPASQGGSRPPTCPTPTSPTSPPTPRTCAAGRTQHDHHDALLLLLSVPPDATLTAIKKAYRKLARQHHPDMNGGDPDAAARFKLITEAYEVLSDPAQRTNTTAAQPPAAPNRRTRP